jgi:hypothetical protein
LILAWLVWQLPHLLKHLITLRKITLSAHIPSGFGTSAVDLAGFRSKPGCAVAVGARIDLVENDHRRILSLCYFAMIQTVIMITTMAMNCSSTRSRRSFCDVLPEPRASY